jgi:hypothetical protein
MRRVYALNERKAVARSWLLLFAVRLLLMANGDDPSWYGRFPKLNVK